jgi:hypothetical protein
VVQQIKGEFQCFDGLLNNYLDRRLVIVKSLDTFVVNHIFWEENSRANFLAHASGRYVCKGIFFTLQRPMLIVVQSETCLLGVSTMHDAAGLGLGQPLEVIRERDSVQESQISESASSSKSGD